MVGLALGIWILWPDGDAASDTATTIATASATTTTMPAGTTSSRPVTTTGGVPDSPVVETVEEAEQILRELWFGWFEGIYNQDEERIREVVATEGFLSSGIAAFESLEFENPPNREGIAFEEADLLMSTDQCFVIWSVSDSTFLTAGPDRVGVDVVRLVGADWRLFSSWTNKGDLWDADCESQLLPLP